MQRKAQLLCLVAALCSMLTLAVAPVAAEDGSAGGGSSGAGQTTTSATENSTTDTSTAPKVEPTDQGFVLDTTKVEDLREEAKSMLQTERKDHTERSTAARQQACAQRQKSIDNRVNDFASAAQRHLNTFNDIFTKVQSFYAGKQLNVSGYAALVATAQGDQTAAQQAVVALKSLDVSVSCSQPDPAQALATVKEAVASARMALQTYRSAIKAIVVALEGASSAQTTTGGNQ